MVFPVYEGSVVGDCAGVVGHGQSFSFALSSLVDTVSCFHKQWDERLILVSSSFEVLVEFLGDVDEVRFLAVLVVMSD